MSADYQTAAALLIAAGDNTPPVFEQIANYVLTSQQGRVTPKYFDILPDGRIATYGTTFLGLGVSDPVNLEKVAAIALRHSVGPPPLPRTEPSLPPVPPVPPPNECAITIADGMAYQYSGGDCVTLDFNAVNPKWIVVDHNDSLETLNMLNLANPSIAISINHNSLLTAINAPSIVSGSVASINHCPLLPSVSLPSYKGAFHDAHGDFAITDCPLLTTLSVPLLQETWSFTIENTGITAISLPSLATHYDVVGIINNPALVSIDWPALIATHWAISAFISLIDCYNNAALRTISMPNWAPMQTSYLNFSGNSLTQATVEHILDRCVAEPAFTAGVLDLSGGTNDPPGNGTGYHNVLVLRGRGITVLHNPLIPE